MGMGPNQANETMQGLLLESLGKRVLSLSPSGMLGWEAMDRELLGSISGISWEENSSE